MKPSFKLFISLALTLSVSLFAETAEEKGLRIAKEADKADTGFGDMSATIKMTLTNRHGQTSERVMRTKSLEGKGDGDKTIIVFDNPRDIKGSSVLTWTHKLKADDQWLYLPELKRVKRISSRNRSGPFMGSEFAYEDLASYEVEKYKYKFIKEEKLNGQDCYVLETDPLDENSGYSRQIVWIRKDRLTQEKIDFYDEKNDLLKTLTFEDYKQYLNKYWRADRFLMINHIKGKKTLLEWQNYKFDNKFTDKDFNKNSLKRSR